ncbi:hypothetical protein LWI29_002911 [Acer saccharum]|uniref:Pentatricopeptide repeat-containing protein n=1 Tax=Acer saccharum TaxID=4024 RepID=A0AA39SEZ6_ACESA|nr:hypothetical protein LWI29_002911 [Acer saccharum]
MACSSEKLVVPKNNMAAYVMAIQRSVQFGVECGLNPCLVESDEALVVKWINLGSLRDSEFGSILLDIEYRHDKNYSLWKATRVMEIVEDSGAVPNIITYDDLISGCCESGEIDNALRLLKRMSIAVDLFFVVAAIWWQYRLKVEELLTTFHSMSKMERSKKMMNQETYLQKRVGKLDEELKKHQRKNKEMEASNLMYYFDQGNGHDDLHETDQKTLIWFAKKSSPFYTTRSSSF